MRDSVKEEGTRCAYTIQTPNNPNTSVFLVKNPPQNPSSSRFHDFNLDCIASRFRCLFADFVISCISDVFHSGPRAGTVTISTGPVVFAPSSCLLSGTCLYLKKQKVYKTCREKKVDLEHYPALFCPNAVLYFGPALLKSA